MPEVNIKSSSVDSMNSTETNKSSIKKSNQSDLHNNIIEKYRLAGDENSLTTNDLFRLLDLYFYKEFYTYRHLHDSYDKFIDDTIPRFFTKTQHTFSEFITENKFIRHKFQFENVRAESPKLSNHIDPMFPSDARHLAKPYNLIIYADVTQIKDVVDINTSGRHNTTSTVVGKTEHNKEIMVVPTMVRSKYCNLNVYKEETRDECKYDPGGYFIVNGSEKVIICQDSMIKNHPMVFAKKNSSVSNNVVQVNSKSTDPMGMMQAISIKIKKDKIMIVKVSFMHEINVMILFRALGIESDRDIVEMCTYDKTDYEMIEILRASLEACVNDNDERGCAIQTHEEAVDYLITKMKITKNYTAMNQKTRLEQKKIHLMDLLKTSILPHIEGSMDNPYREKAYYIGYMVNKLLKVELKRASLDNRDSYTKKRVENIKELLEEIMIQQYKSNMNECNKQFTARMGDDGDATEPYNVIHQFKAGVFEQGFKTSLMMGSWPRKKGVSQMLQRFSYMQLLSFLSRIDSQSGSQASSKLTKPRQIDPSSIPFLCVVGDSEIMTQGLDVKTTKMIKDMKDGDTVLTVNKSDLSESYSTITNFFSRDADDVIEIETISGRKLRCTKDHPVLVSKNTGCMMIRAGDLVVNNKVIIRKTVNCVQTNDAIQSQDSESMYHVSGLIYAVPIKSISVCASEKVYDFTTVSDTHTFIANGFVVSNCIVSTPEHAKIGLVKHLTMIGSITIGDKDNTDLVKEYILQYPDMKNIGDIPASDLCTMFKVFLNGEWLKVIDNIYNVGDSYYDNPAMKFYVDAKVKKISGEFNPQMTSVVFDYKENEIRINTDSGRLYRPVIRINGNNEMMLTKEMIDKISLNATDKEKINDWDEFYMQSPYPIEFIDSEEQPYMMIAENMKELNSERKKIIDSENHVFNSDESKVINRYDNKFFLRYDSMEIHASVLLGEIATNIPFCNKNCAPRNIFQYAQGRQGMGIYCSVYRSRTDISYVLYHPEVPVVNTRTSKYTYTDILPPGSNAVVAIACYSGYNQEDSLVFNMTSLQRGLFRSTSLKKYTSSITKNQETSGNDKFMKPPPDKTVGIKNGQYEKLNEQGYIPEETVITNGDIIFGKVTPINDTTNSGKIFKDSSEQYKSHADGVVDRMYTDIKNQDGYEIRKALIRSERFPLVGDKFCIIDTVNVDVLTIAGWKPLKEITLEDMVATLCDGILKYDNPTEIYAFEYTGDIYKLRSQQVDLDVTIDHELYVKQNDGFELVPASQIIGKKYKLKKNCINNNPDIKTFALGGMKYKYNAYLELLGIFIATGYYESGAYHIAISGREWEMIDLLLKSANTLNIKMNSFKNKTTRITTYTLESLDDPMNKGIYNEFKTLAIGTHDISLPSYVWEHSQQQSRILLNSLLLCNKSEHCRNSDYYYTSSKKHADDIMRLAIHSGWTGIIEKICDQKICDEEYVYGVQIIRTYYDPEINSDYENKQSEQTEETYHYEGIVRCIEVPSHVFMIRQNNKNVWIGNCSRHGQKGTMGIGMRSIDMPFTKWGIRPDIIMNPNAIPSRMTLGQLWECLLGKIGALKGVTMDGTPFEDYDIEAMKDILESLGYHRECEEYLYNGMLGKKIKHMIFIGPTYYQRLKHLVQDKIHSRSRGPVTILTRQSPDGRSRDGGLRLGEMERDAIIAHGLAKFLKERFMDCADAYSTYVCGKCGMFARREDSRYNEPKPGPDDVYYCPMCDNYTDIHQIMIPYAFKLMLQELMAMNIAPRIRVQKHLIV